MKEITDQWPHSLTKVLNVF
uniref:Uncharacterized protein n=1 Tax=Arundo donax TaxID=35708 RepID=A0A0A8Y8D2_ARUDO